MDGVSDGLDELPRKKKTGRAALAPEDRRSIRKEVWLSPTELASLRERAAEHALRPGAYMRLCITDAKLPALPAPAINREAWRELARLSANANQYQRILNEGGCEPWDRELIPQLLDAIRQLRMELLGVPDDREDN